MHSLNHKAAALRRFKPLLDRVLVERMLPETVSEQCDVLTVWHTPDYHVVQKTKSGLMIPEKAQGKVNEAVVIAVGPGARDKVMGERTFALGCVVLRIKPYLLCDRTER